MNLSRVPGIVSAILVGVAAYAITRAILSQDDSSEATSLPQVLKDARQRVTQEHHVPSDAAMGALGEIARLADV